MTSSRYNRSKYRNWLRQLLPAGLIGPARWLRDRLTPQGRMRRWLEANYGAVLLQPSSVTWPDRHPELFAIARERLAGIAAPQILSFGCSTGDEVFTLAEYLPAARIDAIDINPRSIAIAERARRAAGIGAMRFLCQDAPPHEAATYDAIFCLSVLRHGRLDAERPASCASIMPFARFAQTIAALDHTLKPGGLLFVWGSNFRFADTAVAHNFRVIATPGKGPHAGALYGADDMLLPERTNADFVFEKLSGKASGHSSTDAATSAVARDLSP